MAGLVTTASPAALFAAAMPFAGNSVVPAQPIPRWLEIAQGEIGQREFRAKGKHNPRIIEYHDACDLHAQDDETPWCSSFVNWCMMQAGMPRTKSALARSWLKWGRRISEPELGCVVVMSRGSDPRFGHVGFGVRWDSGGIWVLGGNQTRRQGEEFDSVCVKKFPWSKVIEMRMPRAAAASTTIQAALGTGAATAADTAIDVAGPALPSVAEVVANPEVASSLTAMQYVTGAARIVLLAAIAFAIYWIVRERIKKWRENGQ